MTDRTCITCDGTKVVKVNTGIGQWEDAPCPHCSPRASVIKELDLTTETGPVFVEISTHLIDRERAGALSDDIVRAVAELPEGFDVDRRARLSDFARQLAKISLIGEG